MVKNKQPYHLDVFLPGVSVPRLNFVLFSGGTNVRVGCLDRSFEGSGHFAHPSHSFY